MGFWKWYYKGLLKVPRGSIAPWAEFAWAIVLLFVISIYLGIAFTPFCLFFTVPACITMCAHAYWRGEVKKKSPKLGQ